MRACAAAEAAARTRNLHASTPRGSYNHKHGIDGWDRIPHRELWGTTLPELIKDGFAFSWAKTKDAYQSCRNR